MSAWCQAHGHWTHHRVRGGVCTEEYPDPRWEPVYCDCAEYVPHPIPLFATSQCATCARPAAPPSPTTTKDPGGAATTTVPAEATP